MLLLRTIICLFLCLHLTSAQDNTEENNPTISACPPCDCTKPVSCEESDISNPCSCCGRCHKSVGDVCGANEGECTQDLLCLPDDPYSANYIGKCYEITPCLTFGCSEKEGECECYYNNVCPLQRLPYYTREECEDAIKVKKCKEVRCSMKEDCGEGMYFEEGPSFFDDCCPVNGHCVCNVSLCTGPPKSCPVGTKLVMTEAADQKSGKCCNKYECQPITCSYKGVKYAFEEEWMDDTCTTCTCTEGGAECASVNCSEPVDCSITYIPEGKCCPVCFNEPNEALPPETTSLHCITDNGERHEDGNSWDSTPCVMCTCSNGEINCNKKACDVVPCNLDEGQEYVVPMGKCCPICKDATSPTTSATVVFTPSSIVTVATETPPPRNGGGSTSSDGDDMPIDSESTEPGNSDDTPSNEGTPSNEDTPSDMPSNNGDTPSNNEEVNPTRPSNQIRNLVLLLNIPYKEVKSRWEQFSSELADKLREKKITLEDISIMPDVSSTVNATLFTLALKENTTATGLVHEETSESDIAVIVNQMAVDYKMMPEGTAPVVTPYNNTQPSFYESYQTHLTATIIVLTLLAAVSLVSFIGVVIILVIINRRLKTAKTIRGIPTKPSKGP